MSMLRLVYSARAVKSRHEVLDETAMRWVVRLASGELDGCEGEIAAFRAWRDSSPENLAALRRARGEWQMLGVAAQRHERRRLGRLARLVRLRAFAAVAACLVLSIYLGTQYWTDWRFDHVTERGERRSFVLADGTRVLMSADSALDYDDANGVRRVSLARGEVVFDIGHTQPEPFVVVAGGAKYRDIGTVFSVAADGDSSRVLVSSGLVEASKDDRRAIVRAGQALTVESAGIGAVRSADAARELAWTRGHALFQRKPLGEIVNDLRPFYRGYMVVVGDTAASARFTADVDLDHMDDWLDALADSTEVQVHRLGNIVILN